MFRSQPQFAVQTTPAPSTDASVIVLSMACRILHINDSSRAFTHLLAMGPRLLRNIDMPTPLPQPLMDLFYDVLALLEKRIAAEDWSQVEITRLGRAETDTVLLRGFGIPDRTRRQQSRIVLMLQRRSEGPQL
jgi:hypothetical protein